MIPQIKTTTNKPLVFAVSYGGKPYKMRSTCMKWIVLVGAFFIDANSIVIVEH
jgi:hypothetical protein